jgi:hypothetical protein
LKLLSNNDDIVLYPFCGGGTTCAANKNLGRNYLYIEINPEYVAFSEQRINVSNNYNEREILENIHDKDVQLNVDSIPSTVILNVMRKNYQFIIQELKSSSGFINKDLTGLVAKSLNSPKPKRKDT